MPYVNQTGSRSAWADLLGVVAAPTTYSLLKEYRSLCGACAQLNAHGVSNTTFTLRRGDDPEGPEVKSHPFLETLKKPNPYMGTKLLFKHTQLYLEMCGRSYWKLIPGILSPIIEIYPLQSHLVSPIMGVDNQIKGWQYDKEQLTLEQVVQFFCPDPLNPYGTGKGPAELAWSEIVLMNSDTALMTALMRNGGAPGYVMSPKDQQGVVSKTILDRLYAAWNSFRGKGAGKLFIPEIPIELQSLSQTSKEFEGKDRLDFLKSSILCCFNIPSALFSSAGTRAELDAAMVQWSRLAIDPRTTLLEDVINRRILSLFEDDVHLFFDENLYEDQGSAENVVSGLPTPPNPSGETEGNQGDKNVKSDKT